VTCSTALLKNIDRAYFTWRASALRDLKQHIGQDKTLCLLQHTDRKGDLSDFKIEHYHNVGTRCAAPRADTHHEKMNLEVFNGRIAAPLQNIIEDALNILGPHTKINLQLFPNGDGRLHVYGIILKPGHSPIANLSHPGDFFKAATRHQLVMKSALKNT
jgi:hypothetical protein